ncbi:MAG: DUF4149 domain-containing protein [Chloroflexi bacterium]|nr:DUF4149 domain-containing protein [Chloroflexota bacterium]
MRALANLALLLPLALWSGSAFFFTVVAAPRLFATVERPVFAAVVNTLFPIYFTLGVLLLGASTVIASARASRERAPAAILLAALIALAWLGMLGATTWIEPQIGAARALAGTPAGDELFRRAHGLSMIVNGLAMLAVLLAWALIARAHGGPPGSRGAAKVGAARGAREP